jgi:hypothetical protein
MNSKREESISRKERGINRMKKKKGLGERRKKSLSFKN